MRIAPLILLLCGCEPTMDVTAQPYDEDNRCFGPTEVVGQVTGDGCPAVVENPITQITAWTKTFLGQASDTEGRYPKNRQRSAPLFLYSNRTYLLEGRHHEGGGGDFFHLAVEVPSDTMQWDSKREVQKIVIKPLNDREVHAIDLGKGGIDGTYRLSYSFYNPEKERNETVITNKILWDENPREALLGAMGDKVQEDLLVPRLVARLAVVLRWVISRRGRLS